MDALAEKAMALASHLRRARPGMLDSAWQEDLAYLSEDLFHTVQAQQICGDPVVDWVEQLRADCSAQANYQGEDAWLAVLKQDAEGLLASLGLAEGATPQSRPYR